jgi:mRNA interferase HigB
MRVLGTDKLWEFMKKHPQARGPLAAWLAEAESARWARWADLKDRYPRADLVPGRNVGRLVVFDIKGNDYRLVAHVHFDQQFIVVRRVGTHAEYNKWSL